MSIPNLEKCSLNVRAVPPAACLLLLLGVGLAGCSLASNSIRSTRQATVPIMAPPRNPPVVESVEATETTEVARVEFIEATEHVSEASVDVEVAEFELQRIELRTEPEPEPEPVPVAAVVARTEPTTVTAPVPAERPRVRTEQPVRTPASSATSTHARAVTILMDASRSEWAQLRANALEALIADPELLKREVLSGIADENRGVRYVATMAIARAELCELAPFLEPMLDDPAASVRAAAIYGLHACGRDVDPTPLAAMVESDDPEVRGNAYVVLGLLGNPSATRLIRASLGNPLGLVDPVRIRLVELQAAAALVRLGEIEEIEPIRAALFAPVEQAEITALAIQLISELGDEGARQMLVRLVEAPSDQARPPEIRLAAAEAIASLGAREARPLLRLADEYRADPRPATRAQVASMLREVNDGTSDALLTDLMRDEDALVRLAAAGSLLQLASENASGKDNQATASAAVH